MQEFEDEMKKIAEDIELNTVKKYKVYFSYWELYLMEKSYIEEVLALFKSINGIKLIQDEMNYLKEDLLLISSFPNIIVDKHVRINIQNIKEKIIKAIDSHKSKILKTSEDVLVKLLESGYEETVKAKKLNEITPYNTIAEYANFVKLLDNRNVDKLIEKIAINAIVVKENWEFLEKHNYAVRESVVLRYL